MKNKEIKPGDLIRCTKCIESFSSCIITHNKIYLCLNVKKIGFGNSYIYFINDKNKLFCWWSAATLSRFRFEKVKINVKIQTRRPDKIHKQRY